MNDWNWGRDLWRIALSAIIGSMITALGSYVALNAKASQWIQDKPYIEGKLDEVASDVKKLLDKVSRIEAKLEK